MDSLGKIKDHILRNMLTEKGFIMDYVQMVVDKFFLYRSVIPLNNAIDLGTPRIDKQMGDICCLQRLMEFPRILRTVVCLPVLEVLIAVLPPDAEFRINLNRYQFSSGLKSLT